MKRVQKKISSIAVAWFLCGLLPGQELDPGAYSISPVGANIAVVTNIFNKGDLNFDPSGPIEDARATINATALGYVRALNIAGRSGNIGIVLPYVLGDLQGVALGQFQQITRSGLRDPVVRFSVNLYGAPAMELKQFAGYQQKTNIGVSLLISAPLGQYDPAKLVNIGQNRWGFKPEIGLSRVIGKWNLELYSGVWLFTDNNNFYGGRKREQEAIGSLQFHLIHTFRRRLWAAFDANYYYGGRTTVDRSRNFDLQRNSRMGGTVALPLNRQSSLKFSYSRGARTTIGGDFHSVTTSYQYLWGL